MKLIIAGGRDFVPQSFHWDWLDELRATIPITEVVCGMANGGDSFGLAWAKVRGIPVTEFPADWSKHGRAAGPIRNGQMAAHANAVVLFPGGKGTANMHKQATERGLEIYDWRERM